MLEHISTSNISYLSFHKVQENPTYGGGRKKKINVNSLIKNQKR